jgi:ACS family pantothenate transporter-like MFS transporter
MTVPVGLGTFFFLPDTPHKTHAWFLSKSEIQMALERMEKAGKATPVKITLDTFKKIFSRWSKISTFSIVPIKD